MAEARTQKSSQDESDCCSRSSCEGEAGEQSPLQKKPKLWSHHLLRIVSPSHDENPASTSVVSSTSSEDKNQPIVFLKDPDRLQHAIFQKDTQLAVWRRPHLPCFIESLAKSTLDQSQMPAFYGTVTPENCKEIMRKMLLLDIEKDHQENTLGRREIEELIDDVQHLVSIFGSIISGGQEFEDDNESVNNDSEENSFKETPAPEVHIRLERLDSNGCAYWHQDTVPLRLVTTYRGPCTEYVDPVHSKETLQNHTSDSKHSQFLTHHDVAIFKGRIFDEEADENEEASSHSEGSDVAEDTTISQSREKSTGIYDRKANEKLADDEDILPDLDSPGIVHRSPRIEGSDIVRLVLVIDIPADFHTDDTSTIDDEAHDENG